MSFAQTAVFMKFKMGITNRDIFLRGHFIGIFLCTIDERVAFCCIVQL